MSVRVQILDYVNTNGDSLSTGGTIDWDKSIVGELDITDHSDFPLALTFSIADIRDIEARSGSFSKTFKIPATKNNNQLLKSLYVENTITDNNVLSRKKCRVMVNNLYSLNGSLKITASAKKDNPSYYSCVFYGDNLAWSSALDEKYIHQLDWGSSGEGLELNKTSIMSTWTHQNSFSSNSPVVYPVVSYGEYNPDGITGTIQLLDIAADATTGSSLKTGYYGFDNSNYDYTTPVPSLDWRPVIWVKDTIELIFSTIGYQISSSFMDSAMFKRLVWALPSATYNNSDERYEEYLFKGKFNGEGLIDTVTLAAGINGSYGYDKTPINLSATGSDFYVDSDDSASWDSVNGYLEFKEFGFYKISMDNFGGRVGNPTHTSGVMDFDFIRLQMQIQTVGQTNWKVMASSEYNTDFTLANATGGKTFSFTNSSLERYFNKGDKIRVRVWARTRTANSLATFDVAIFGSSSVTSATTSTSANGIFKSEFRSQLMEYGQTYDLKDVINKEYKQMDFIKGISHAFNLQFTTDESTKTISIEPFNDFYLPLGSALDYTYKLDRSKELSDKFLETDIKRSILFKYKSDGKDAKVKYRSELWWDSVGDEHPYRETLSDDFKKGDSKFENPFFAGTFNGKDQDTTGAAHIRDTVNSAILWEDNNEVSSKTSRGAKGNDFLPRLLYWKRYSADMSLNPANKKQATLQTWATATPVVTADSSSLNAISNSYPQATSLNKEKLDSPNLCYGNAWVADYDDSSGVYSASVAHKGLYETYYAGQMNILKSNPRIRTAYIDLKITDIVNLDFRKLVYIDGVYWRLNKIIDFKPNQNTSTKVELLEWLQLGDILASNPSTIATNGDYDPVPDDSDDLAL